MERENSFLSKDLEDLVFLRMDWIIFLVFLATKLQQEDWGKNGKPESDDKFLLKASSESIVEKI